MEEPNPEIWYVALPNPVELLAWGDIRLVHDFTGLMDHILSIPKEWNKCRQHGQRGSTISIFNLH